MVDKAKINILSVLVLVFLFRSCNTFTPSINVGGFNFPKIFDTTPTSSLQPGDTITVIGASGNVGKLVTLRLADTFKINAVTRSITEELKDFFNNRKNVQLFSADVIKKKGELDAALKDANAIVICTGTTAFPTKAWSSKGEFSVSNEVFKSLLKNKFNIESSLEDLNLLGLNTPKNVDDHANSYIIKTWSKVCNAKKKRAIMLSSIGVQRRTTMPFPILNTCGVLDAKAAGEASLVKAASEEGFSYTIIRPGQLFGGPYDNNYYLGTLFQLDKDAATQGIDIGKGDQLLGDTLRSTLAEITAQICEADCAKDMDFAVVNVKGEPPSIETLQERLKTL